jgi:hypothetical protein
MEFNVNDRILIVNHPLYCGYTTTLRRLIKTEVNGINVWQTNFWIHSDTKLNVNRLNLLETDFIKEI